MTAGDLHDALARLGADLMVRALGALERGTLQLTPQPEAGVTYAAKIDKSETRIDWSKPWQAGARPLPRTLAVSRRLVRACGRERVKVLRTTRGEGSARPARCSTIASLSRAVTARCGFWKSSAPASSR